MSTGNTPSPGSGAVSAADCLLFTDRALDNMARIVTELGDENANRAPGPPGGNTPYQILTHCLGVCEFWGGAMIAGRDVQRDRDAEFTATGSVTTLAERARAAKQRLRADVERLRPHAATSAALPPSWNPTREERDFTQGEALVHIVEELCQHLGHMEITRDILLAA